MANGTAGVRCLGLPHRLQRGLSRRSTFAAANDRTAGGRWVDCRDAAGVASGCRAAAIDAGRALAGQPRGDGSPLSGGATPGRDREHPGHSARHGEVAARLWIEALTGEGKVMKNEDRLVRTVVIGFAVVEALVIAVFVALQLHVFGR